MQKIRKIFLAFTSGEKTVFFIASGAAFASSLALIIFGYLTSTKTVPAPGGEYTEGAVGQTVFINPVLASSEIDKSLVRLIFSNVNDIAEKVERSDDGRIWKIRLKEKLRWQDGEKLTSDDVIFTVQKIQDPESSSPLSAIWQGVAAQRLSELEVQFSLVNPYAFFENILKDLYLVPKHVFRDIPSANWKLSDYNLNPIGSGPYKFLSFGKKSNGFIEIYRLISSNNYFNKKALIEKIDFRFFSSVEDLIKSFNLGQVDAFSTDDPTYLSLLGRSSDIVPLRLPNYFAVFFNQNKNVALKEIDVRRALSLSIERKQVIEEALQNYASPAFGPISSESEYFAKNLSDVSTSIDWASSTLTNAGWKLRDDGFREKTIQKTKIPAELNLLVPKIKFLVKTASIIARQWRNIGVKVNVNIVGSNDLAAAIKNRDYEILLFGNILSRGPDLFSFWHSSERFYPGLNLALYNSKKVDSLIETIRQNVDEKSRSDELAQLQKTIASDYPAVFLYSPYELYVSNKNIRGIGERPISEPAERFSDAPNWYLKTARVLK